MAGGGKTILSTPIIKGNDLDFNDLGRFVAIIGSREASKAENERAYELGRTLASSGLIVVSGLAKGIDIHAHMGALSAYKDKPTTLAILSTSPKEEVYPNKHSDIAEEISHKGSILYPYESIAPWTKERFGPKQKRLAERSVMQAVVSSSIYVISDNDYIEGGTRWAVNYGAYLGRNIFRMDSNGKVYHNPEYKVEKRLITWNMELDWQSCYQDLLNKEYKYLPVRGNLG